MVSSGLKPLAAILCGLCPPSPALARAILGYGFYLAAGRKFRSSKDRIEALNTILNIEKDRESSPGEPGTPDPVARPRFSREFDITALRQCAGLIPEFSPNVIRATCLAGLAVASSSTISAESFLAEFKKLLEDTAQGRLSVFGTSSKEDEEDAVGALALQGIRSPEHFSRISVSGDCNNSERFYLFPDVSSSQGVVKYVGHEVALVYESRYEAALQRKRYQEDAIKSALLIESLLKAPTADCFIKKLNATTDQNTPSISSRSSPGYPELIRSLLDLSTIDLGQDQEVCSGTVRLQKIWVLILGRDSQGNPVWNHGNVLREDLHPYRKVFERLDPSGDLWIELRRMHSAYSSTHVYRPSNIPNRHGHSVLLPSWWARGYASLDEFKVC